MARAQELCLRYAGVVAWKRDAGPDEGDFGEPTVFFSRGEDAKYRIAELGNRCYLARRKIGVGNIIVGVGIAKHIDGVGSTTDLVHLNLPYWSPDDDEKAAAIEHDLGFFEKSKIKHIFEDEYPSTKKKRRPR